MAYQTFTRTWYRPSAASGDGREPGAGRKTYHRAFDVEDHARQACREWNDTHNSGKYSRKMEYTKI